MLGADEAATISVPKLQGCSADSAPSLTLAPPTSDGPFPCLGSSEADSSLQTKTRSEKRSHTRNKLCMSAKSLQPLARV